MHALVIFKYQMSFKFKWRFLNFWILTNYVTDDRRLYTVINCDISDFCRQLRGQKSVFSYSEESGGEWSREGGK